MVSTFGGINIAHSALSASRMALEVSGQNVANMQDPNYSKQVVRTDSRFLNSSGIFSGQHASFDGVGITQLSRVTDQFAISRHNGEISSEGFKNERLTLMREVEGAYNEPSEHGLQNTLAQFWDSWDQLGNTPEEPSSKTAVVRRAQAVTESIKYAATNLDTLREHHYKRLEKGVEQANAIIRGIAEVNEEISAASLDSQFPPNELLDKRDAMVRELSKFGKVTTSFSKTNEMYVHLNGNGIVGGGGSFSQLKVEKTDTDTNGGLDFRTKVSVVFGNGTPRKIDLPEGSLKAIQDNIDKKIVSEQDKLDEVTFALFKQVNDLHMAGRAKNDADPTSEDGSREFFAYPGKTVKLNSSGKMVNTEDDSPVALTQFKGIARAITVNGNLVKDPMNVATRAKLANGKFEGPLGNGVAVAIGNIANKSDSPEALYRNHLTDLGVQTKSAKASLDQQKAQTKRANEERLSVSGVNADEETINMAAMLKAYQASARYMSALDSMLDTLINGTGLVGR